MALYRKKPVVIEAHRFAQNGSNSLAIAAWCGGVASSDAMGRFVEIDTPEGTMLARPGDWIIREPFPTGDRQFYPCKPDIFAATYEEVQP